MYNLGGKDMRINCNEYEVKDVIRIMRDTSGKTQTEFAKSIKKTRGWCAQIEGGTINILLKDFLLLAKINNINIIMEEVTKSK